MMYSYVNKPVHLPYNGNVEINDIYTHFWTQMYAYKTLILIVEMSILIQNYPNYIFTFSLHYVFLL